MTAQIIHSSLHRPNFILGGDRELVILSFILSGCVAGLGSSVVAVIIAVLFWFISLSRIRKYCAKDPKIRDVLMRSFQQQRYYAAHPRIWRYK